MGSQTSQSCFKWGNHSLVSQCVFWTESLHQRVPGPICCGAVLDILNEAVLPPASCRADGNDDLRIPTVQSKLGHLFHSITWYFSFMWPFSNYYKTLSDVMFYVGKNSSIRC